MDEVNSETQEEQKRTTETEEIWIDRDTMRRSYRFALDKRFNIFGDLVIRNVEGELFLITGWQPHTCVKLTPEQVMELTRQYVEFAVRDLAKKSTEIEQQQKST